MKTVIEAEFDLEELKEQIDSAKDIKDNESFFSQLSEVARVKKELNDLLDRIMTAESEAKNMINAKAKALYGDNWQVIKGEKFKITRSKTGDMYLISGTPGLEFVKTKVSADSKAIDAFVEQNEKLPDGIELNDKR